MAAHETFNFQSLEDLRRRIEALALDLPLTEDIRPLLEPLQVGPFTLTNRMIVLPMEGCDGTPEGAPDELTFRRYRRFAAGGAALLWFEATAVVPEGRANPRQLWLHERTVPAFAALVRAAHEAAAQPEGREHRPVTILQLTHSGRYSRPGRVPTPIIAHHSPYLDPPQKLPADYPLITDDDLERLEDAYVEAARCAHRAGFDGVDVKACHRYLISELHASFTRDPSRYGGPAFENRSRFFRNVVGKIRDAVPGLLVTARLNVYDAMAYPYGFGVHRRNPAQPDLSEPLALVRFLAEQGAPLVNITIGNPYYNPHVNRPFDVPTTGAPLPGEPPLLGVARFVRIVREIQTAHPGLAVIGGGYSWLRQFLPNVAAAALRQQRVSLIGLGRMAFAYPDCVRDLQTTGRFAPHKVCVTCSACTQIMRDGGRAGCVPRDGAVYGPIYKQGRADAVDTIMALAATCRQCSDAPCVEHCPARIDIPRFLGHMAQGRFRQAYEVLRQSNMLAAICGCVCPAEVLCEAGCINQFYSAPVPIRRLQRWVSCKAVEEGWTAEPRPALPRTGKRVAILGAGPAGIAAAIRLASLGHVAVLHDRASAPGGAAQDVIPNDRLPPNILRREIHDVLASHGDLIQHRHATLTPGFTLDDVMAAGFDAAVLAPGLGRSVPLPCPTRPRQGAIGALEFLAAMKLQNTLPRGSTVLVLGGGNTAIDAALTARRAGVSDVAIVYRRSFAEMPAWPEEREQALAGGVCFLMLTAPQDYVVDDHGKLTGLKVIRTRLGDPDAGGRRRPLPIAGTEHVLPADLVIEALGQQLDETLKAALTGVQLTEEGLIRVHPGRLETSRPGVFAAGDAINGGTTVVRAVAEGTRAAEHVDAFLRQSRPGADAGGAARNPSGGGDGAA
ncbi:MAG: FAD-dependent oxidoreductase [Verrucomicrobia bacterium]|nr:FAD-dependent oxidoreductase [Verrucomicrobiota bacterium]